MPGYYAHLMLKGGHPQRGEVIITILAGRGKEGVAERGTPGGGLETSRVSPGKGVVRQRGG